MKKVLIFMLSVCLVVILIPVVSYGADVDQTPNDVQAQEDVPAQGDTPELSEDPLTDDPDSDQPVPETPGQDVNENHVKAARDVVETAPSEAEILSDEGPDTYEEDPSQEERNGWEQDSNGWRYYADGNYLTKMQLIDGRYYLFSTLDGYVQTGLQTVETKQYYFDPTPGDPSDASSTYGTRLTGWISVPGRGKSYFGPEMKTGWQTISKKKYFFNKSSGVMKKGWLTLSNKKYYLDPKTGAMKTGWQTISKKKYYFNTSSGVMKKGWLKLGNKKYYFDPKTGVMKTNADRLVEKMKLLAWAYGTPKAKWKYKKGAPKAVCKKAMNKYGYKGRARWSDCGDFVTTVVREAGIDKKFKALRGLKSPFPKSNKFKIVLKGKKIPKGFLKPGDIIRYKKTNGHQHAMFYFGNGKVCDAGHYSRFGNIRKDEKRYAWKNVRFKTLQVLRVKD